MLDAISGGRLDCGFGRAFLPHEFQRFERSMDESRARFEEGMEAVRLLLEQENVTFEGQFYRFRNVTSLPRPTQRPRPPFWTAALGTPESLRRAGERGFNLMLVPFAGPQMREAIRVYREAWREARHPGQGRIALGFHMFCHEDREEARTASLNPTLMPTSSRLVAAAGLDSGWGAGTSSGDYPNYDSHMDKLRQASFDTLLDSGTIWVGTPCRCPGTDRLLPRRRGRVRHRFIAGQLPPHFPVEDAAASMRLFSALRSSPPSGTSRQRLPVLHFFPWLMPQYSVPAYVIMNIRLKLSYNISLQDIMADISLLLNQVILYSIPYMHHNSMTEEAEKKWSP